MSETVESTGLLVGRYLRFQGGRVWHRIREVRVRGGYYTLPTVCGATGESVAAVEVGDVPRTCSKCEAGWDAMQSNGREQDR